MPKIVASKKDWIELGYKLFSEAGEVGLNVDKMSRLLMCNKSSFYWHFKTKLAFVNELVEYWIELDTLKVMKLVDEPNSPLEQFLKLIAVTFQKDSNLDFIFYLKKYSQKNENVRKTVDRIDKQRIAFVSKILSELGYPREQSKIKALIFYKYLIGYHEMIRYKKQKKNYLSEVLAEINHFIKID